MRYAHSNFEAFVRPEKPPGIEGRSTWIIGSGLGGMAAAAFLIRDAHMTPSHITILDASGADGGALDGAGNAETGWLIRGGREMEEQFQCLWDLYRSIPSLEVQDVSVLDEFYRLNRIDPSSSPVRAMCGRGQPLPDRDSLKLTGKARREIISLILTDEKKLDGKTIRDVLSADFMKSNFWLFWRSMFAFETWHSAIEMKRYLARFVHQILGLKDLHTLKFTRFNQQESLSRPLATWLAEQGVMFRHGIQVTNVRVDTTGGKKVASHIDWLENEQPGGINIPANDLVFVTNGSMVENSRWGNHHAPAPVDTTISEGNIWQLWRNIAAQDSAFGRPDVFCGDTTKSRWESATVTTLDARIPELVHKVTGRDPFSGRTVTGGPITIQDSAWLMSWVVSRQPHFKNQPEGQMVAWLYGLFSDVPGNYVKKPMQDCTGEEITREWLFHMGVPEDQIDDMAATGAITHPCMMPFITAQFMPRSAGDRPKVVPDGSVNLAFLGQFAETPRDTVFTTEYSVRTAMEAVYTLLDIDRAVPEVFGSVYDIRMLLQAAAELQDGKKIPGSGLVHHLTVGTEIDDLLDRYGLI
ncbi:oleate hydratase [Komagataeibacter oboediens]|uniref:Oleate hydratase n=1 Tax=Komagataeibacter oboediens TaxID=65958 RepID=A0ABS5SJW9_9PROT|nr:oleate hydratase [Komagataeibacter oboediens]MBL7234663.1 oleate hydratase [Komagataeibacter oboediens]MBT0674531.1 oleate hydratase [Komagataeibacter oboediens]MBT0677693.1 oleate hydratase [Komagataeibacter oboediens]